MNKPALLTGVFAAFFASSVFAQIQTENYQGQDVVAHEVLVGTRNSITPQSLDQLVQANDIQTAHRVGSAGTMVLHSRSLSVDALIRSLANHPDLAYVEPNAILHAINTTPNDTSFTQMWGLNNTGQVIGNPGTPGADIRALLAWDISTGSKSIVVGVVDTGIDYNHIDLAPNIWSAPSDFMVTIGGQNITCLAGTHGFNAITRTCDPLDDNDHGSHVSGTIGAAGNNATGVTGINWTASIMGLKFLDSTGTGSTAAAVDAIDFAIQVKNIFGTSANVRVLSNSWGGSGFSQSLLNEIQVANSNNMLFVVAAGNDGVNIDTTPQYPAVFSKPAYNAPNVVTVAATTNTDARASFSNYGPTSVNLGAPGLNILSTVRGNAYAFFSGTSMATPHVSGAAALILSVCSLSTADLKSTILNNIDPVLSMAGITTTGGRLDLNKAIRSCAGTVNPDFALAPTPLSRTLGAGSSTSYIISAAPTGGFNGSINLSVAGLPAGATGSFSPNPVLGPGASTLTVNTSNTVVPGTYSFTITGVSGALTHTTKAKLIVSVPSVSLSNSSLTFTTRVVNTTSAPINVTLTNNGPGTLTIGSIAVTGANPGDFGETTNCPAGPATLAANSSCNISITFTPAATGARTAALTITDNGSGSPQSVTLSGTGIATQPAPWPNGYTYQATFTVAGGQVPSSQTNFATLISGTYPDLASAANGGRIANTCTQTVGTASLSVPCDLIFTADAAGTTLLNWEFDSYNASTGAVALWVKVPALATGTTVYAWYGNAAVTTLQSVATSAWGSDYLAAYHLKESTTGAAPQLMDSTAGAHNGTMGGPVDSGQQAAGQVGGSLNFSSTKAWATLANPADFGFERTDSFSVAGWFKTPSNTGGALVSKLDGSATRGWALFQFPTGTTPRYALGLIGDGPSKNNAMAATPALPMGVWHYVVATYTGTSTVAGMQIYIDGVNQPLTTISDTLTLSIANAITPELNGEAGGNSNSSDGIDEVRVFAKGVVLAPDWVTASYNNQHSPATFFTVSTGLTNPNGTGPAVNLSANTLTFGNQTTNTTSAAQSVTVTNTGSGALTINSIAMTGTNAGDFAQTTTCPISPATLAANANCTVSVTFTPTAAGARTASVAITDNATGSPQTITLNGTGVVPAVGLSSPSLTFANQFVNTTSALQTVTVTNNGLGLLTISSIGMTGTNAGDFAQTTTCPISPATLAPNANCTVSVTFTPTAGGARTASVTITDNAPGSPQAVTLNGTGVMPPWPNGYAYQATFTVAAGQAPSAQLNFPAVIAGTFADFRTIANGGRVANTCTQTVGTTNLAVPCDVVFTSDAAGTSLLSWEFDSYNASTGAITVWVKVPALATGTTVYAWYGNAAVTTLQSVATSAWGSDYLAAYHLKESTTGAAPQLMDSTAGAHNGTMGGPVNSGQQAAGQVGGSLNFSSTKAWATLANPADFGFERTDSFSVAGWFKTPSNTGGALVSKLDGSATTGWALFQFATGTTPRYALGLIGDGPSKNFAMAATPALTMGIWHYVVATYTGTSTVAGMQLYIDGVNQPLTTISDTLTGSIANAITPELNGEAGGNSNSSDGIDEVRVFAKGVVLSPGWVTASYNNQHSPATFFTVSTGLTNPGNPF